MSEEEKRRDLWRLDEEAPSESDESVVDIPIDVRGDSNLRFRSTKHHREELTKAAEELGVSRSAAIRHWIEIGRRSMIANDPRNKELDPESSTSVNPIRDLIPEGEQNAIDLRDELPNKIEDNLLDIVDRDDQIERDGWKVYK